MNLDQTVKQLSEKFGVPAGSVRDSLVGTDALRGINANGANYTLRGNTIFVIDGKRERSAVVNCSTVNGEREISVSRSRKPTSRLSVKDDLFPGECLGEWSGGGSLVARLEQQLYREGDGGDKGYQRALGGSIY
ncbi:MAG: hypothetical protein V1702_03370 [Candidatus Woesearchaeota archaeon]